MDLSMHRPAETFPYRHKKFDVHKRPYEEDTETYLVEAIQHRTTPASHFLFNPLFGGVAERVLTPFSTDSNCSSDYAGFVNFFNATSTPTAKRRRLLTGSTQYTISPSEDSGISLTPQKISQTPQHQGRALKRTLKPSALAEPLAKQQKIAETPNTSNKLIADMAVKRRKTVTIPKSNGIKAALKPALKPTPAGTLDITATTTAPNTLPAAAATVLSRISEDKLRSICTYHGNMVRQFPKKERSPKDQERRNKNTIACRMSRRLKKLEHIAVEVQLKEYEQEYTQLMEERLRVQTFMEQLTQLTSVLCKNEMPEEEPEIDVVSVESDERAISMASEWNHGSAEGVQMQKNQIGFEPTPAAAMPIITSAFSIAYLMGSLRK